MLLQMSCQLVDIVCGWSISSDERVVGAEHLNTAHRLYIHDNLLDAVEGGYLVLYLTKLDAQAAHLHLVVDTPEELHLAIIGPAYKVTGAVSLHAAKFDELLSRQLRTVQVATCHTCAADQQLTGNTAGNKLTLRIDDEELDIVDALSDVFAFEIASNLIIVTYDGGFGRTVEIEEGVWRRCHWRHLLAACAKHAECIVHLYHQTAYLGSEERNGYTFLLHILVHEGEVIAQVIPQYIQTGTCRHGWIHVKHMGVEAEVGVCGHTV